MVYNIKKYESTSKCKKRCLKCKIVKRRGVLYMTCENPRHKQRQG